MPRLLHISDLHFGPPFVGSVGEALLRLAPELGADAIVASGDFTQRAKPRQFAEARAFLDRLPDVPLVVTPGNHDVPLWRVGERARDPLGLYRRHIEDRLDYVTALPAAGDSPSVDAVIVSVDSTSPRRAISGGRIHLDQLAFCEEALRGLPSETVKVVVAHHHFSPAPDYERDSAMPKWRRALDRFVDLGVDLILGGHLHRAYIGNSLDLYRGADPNHGIIIVQSGTTTSRRGRGKEREKNSLNVIDVDAGMIRVTHYLYVDGEERFTPISRHLFPRPGRPFIEPT